MIGGRLAGWFLRLLPRNKLLAREFATVQCIFIRKKIQHPFVDAAPERNLSGEHVAPRPSTRIFGE